MEAGSGRRTSRVLQHHSCYAAVTPVLAVDPENATSLSPVDPD